MKKLVLLCFLFVFSSTFYAQSSNTVKEPTKRKSGYDYNKDVTVKTPVKKENVKKETKVLEKKVTAKKETVSKVAKKKVAKTIKETNEKAPKKADKITGTYNGKKVYTGPRGGKYYINKNGNKTYVQD
jgi:colicin import membrane protein